LVARREVQWHWVFHTTHSTINRSRSACHYPLKHKLNQCGTATPLHGRGFGRQRGKELKRLLLPMAGDDADGSAATSWIIHQDPDTEPQFCRIYTHTHKKNTHLPAYQLESTVFFSHNKNCLPTYQTALIPAEQAQYRCSSLPKSQSPSPATDDATIAEYDDVFPDMLPWAGLYLTTKIMFQICLVIILKWPQSFSTEALKRAYVANKNLAFDTGIKPQPPPLIQLSHQILPQVCLCPVNIGSGTATPFISIASNEYLSRRSLRLRAR